MPPAVGLAIAGVSSAIGTIAAAKKQQRASEQALEYEKSLDRYKLATEANRYAALREGIEPYIQTGGAADARMAMLLGLPAPGPAASPPPRYPTPPLPDEPPPPRRVVPRGSAAYRQGPGASPPPDSASTGAMPGPAPTGAMRLMQAPDGTLQHVPESEREYWESRGARAVN